MDTSNPVFGQNTFANVGRLRSGAVMTVNGAVNKTAILLLLLVIAAAYTWNIAAASIGAGQAGAAAVPWMLGGALGGFVVALVTVFKQEWSPVTAPIYAILEGLFLGAISAFFQAQYQGLVAQAILLTLAVLLCMLALYRTGVIQVTDKFRMGVVAATAGIFLFYLATWVISLFGVRMPFLYNSSLIGIAISVVVVIIAALNLVLDFDFIDRGAQMQAPQYMEWYAAFGLMVTLIWLYLEILRLLSRLNRR
jgi:uncharacterized YccA/Bax inhibitor family protein